MATWLGITTLHIAKLSFDNYLAAVWSAHICFHFLLNFRCWYPNDYRTTRIWWPVLYEGCTVYKTYYNTFDSTKLNYTNSDCHMVNASHNTNQDLILMYVHWPDADCFQSPRLKNSLYFLHALYLSLRMHFIIILIGSRVTS